jgi:hypothetical protein
VGLEQCPLSLVGTTEELLGRKSRGSGLEIEITVILLLLDTSLSAKVGTNFTDQQQLLGWYSLLAD